ncbi:uncharacterized protein LOC112903623 [Panicum hallii]|uniref:uncharacterized protein LOC112903623 n=1 Tax=Panicum hallii TaxID=206008 RepID=UPI000DF4DDDA|nr:uncharacterized protein LOC112903623 [Panicum hallii]
MPGLGPNGGPHCLDIYTSRSSWLAVAPLPKLNAVSVGKQASDNSKSPTKLILQCVSAYRESEIGDVERRSGWTPADQATGEGAEEARRRGDGILIGPSKSEQSVSRAFPGTPSLLRGRRLSLSNQPASSATPRRQPEFVGAGGGNNIFRVPLRTAMHPAHLRSLRLRFSPPSLTCPPAPYDRPRPGSNRAAAAAAATADEATPLSPASAPMVTYSAS